MREKFSVIWQCPGAACTGNIPGGIGSPRFPGLLRCFSRRIWMLGLLGAVCGFASGCELDPEQKLIGRWYNSDMSIRFRPDGGVIFNTPAGRAVGRYYYDGSFRPVSSGHVRENLVLDVVRNGERLRLGFEVEVIAANRLRIYDLNNRVRPGERPDRVSSMVLKRATDDDKKTF
jgi:hypothetical protein